MVDQASFGRSIDGVVVINLDRRPDRWAEFRSAWNDRLDWDRVVRLSAIDGRTLPGAFERPWFRGRNRDSTWVGRAGCALSHRAALQTAQDMGWRYALVLEDDAVPADAFPDALAKVCLPESFNLFYLGCGTPRHASYPLVDGTIPIEGALDLHAYVTDPKARERLLEGLPHPEEIWRWIAHHRAVDRWIDRKLEMDVACIWPPIANQRADKSDINQRIIDHSSQRSPLSARPPRPSWIRRFERGALDLGDGMRAATKPVVGF